MDHLVRGQPHQGADSIQVRVAGSVVAQAVAFTHGAGQSPIHRARRGLVLLAPAVSPKRKAKKRD